MPGAEAGRSGPGDDRGRALRPARRGERPHRREAGRCRSRRRGGEARGPFPRRVGRRRRRLVRRATATGKTPSPDAVNAAVQRQNPPEPDGGLGMSVLSATAAVLDGLVPAGRRRARRPVRRQGLHHREPDLADQRDGHRAPASIIVFVLLWKYAGPIDQKSFADRTAGSRRESTIPRRRRSRPRPRRPHPWAQGDIESERARLHAEAETQADALIVDGRTVSTSRWPNSKLAPRRTSPPPPGVHPTNCVPRSPATRRAIDRIVDETLDDATHQALIEGFIQRVGASTGASS